VARTVGLRGSGSGRGRGRIGGGEWKDVVVVWRSFQVIVRFKLYGRDGYKVCVLDLGITGVDRGLIRTFEGFDDMIS
jgi:hypothetical protein